MNDNPLVSIIVATKNEENNIVKLCESVKNQTYKNIELIIVDNGTDRTKELAAKYTSLVFSFGPERCAQRNMGLVKASGDFVLFLDADMTLSENVVTECVAAVSKNAEVVGVIIPEESYGEGFWARCVILEKSFYVGVDGIEAARFFNKKIVVMAGGYDELLVSGEDWDLHKRVLEFGKVVRIPSLIFHDEGHATLIGLVKKKIYYAKHFWSYLRKHVGKGDLPNQLNLKYRYKLWFSQPDKLFKNLLEGMGLLFIKTLEFALGGIVLCWFNVVGRTPAEGLFTAKYGKTHRKRQGMLERFYYRYSSSTYTERKLFELLAKYTKGKSDLQILDIGCGGGHEELVDYGRVCGVDLSNEGLQNARKTYFEAKDGDITDSIPYPTGTFDVGFCSEVMGHILVEKKNTVMDEILRVIKPGGLVLFSVETAGINWFTKLLEKKGLYSKYWVTYPGHIGLESPQDTVQRMHKKLGNIQYYSTSKSLLPVDGYLVFSDEVPLIKVLKLSILRRLINLVEYPLFWLSLQLGAFEESNDVIIVGRV